MLVTDASVLVTALTDDVEPGERARDRLSIENVLAAPSLIDLEVTSTLRRRVQAGRLSRRRAALSLTDLLDLPILRTSPRELIPRCWALRENLTTYDATYVALAEAYGCRLLTLDRRMTSAPGVRCRVEILT